MGRARFPAGEAREALAVDGRPVALAEVSMGNPHAVIEHDAPDDVVRDLGPAIEVDPRFPERTNVEFVRARRPLGADHAGVGARASGRRSRAAPARARPPWPACA